MKSIKFFTVSLVLICLFGACEKDTNNFAFEDIFSSISEKYEKSYSFCLSPNDAIVYPEPWTQEASSEFSISQELLEITSTCGLLETFYNQPWLTLGPWCSICSDLNIDGIDYFNRSIAQNEVIQELVKRDDVVETLSNKYLSIIKKLDSEINSKSGNIQCLEMLLASDAIRPFLTEQQAEELMVSSLKMISVQGNYSESPNITTTRHILVSMLLRLNYQPFMDDKCFDSGILETWLFGYKICADEKSPIEQYANDYFKKNIP